ncbi:MAG: discoidin domain-containing protein, partial [Planctomycetota bacterium]
PINSATSPSCDFCDSNSPDCDPSYAQITPPGTHYITVTATDYNLNESDFSFELEMPIDQIPPPSTTTSTIISTTTSPTTTTTSPTTTTSVLTNDGIIYENSEDQTTARWYVYDDTPAGAEIDNVFDSDLQSNVIQFSGAGKDNGYRLTDSRGNLWRNANHFILQWSMKYTESFGIYIDLKTTAGHRYLTYTPHDYNNLGYGEYVEHGLGTDAVNGQWHTFVRDLRADLAQSQPGATILEVNGFLIRGSGMVDNIMLLNDSPSSTTTIPITPQEGEYCSTDPDLVLDDTTPEEGNMRVALSANALPQDSITQEDGEDGTTDRWYVYDNTPSGGEITNVFDSGRQSRVIEFSGAGWDNGYRLTNPDGTFWNNSSHFIVKWSMKYAELFSVFIDLDTTAGHRYLTYRPNDYNSLGDGEYVFYGLGENATDGQWHTYVRDLQADLNVAQPGVTILEVNGFLIRGSGMVDDIKLISLNDAISPYLRLTLFDPDTFGEGYLYVNGNGPINLPTGNYNDLEHTFQIPISATCLIQGENSFRFVHASDRGYEVRELCIGGLLGSSSVTSTIPSPRPSTTTTTPDEAAPTGSVVINQGSKITNSRLVTLTLSAEDEERGMGTGALMMLSNDNQEWFGPKPFASTKLWVLTPGEGNKKVYAKFCDEAGNWMDEPANDSIEFQLSCPQPLQMDATALECSGSFSPAVSEEKSVDGKRHTGWLSPLRTTPQEEYITIDLGETRVVNRIEISSNGFLLLNLFPRDFKLQGSTDNYNWVDLSVVTNYTPPLSRNDSWIFDETEARYIKVVTTRGKRFMFFFHASYIAEIKVHGCAEPAIEIFELRSTRSSDQTRTDEEQQTLDEQAADKQQLQPSTGLPGRPGRPVFILEGNP